jgi:hypothetical protein
VDRDALHIAASHFDLASMQSAADLNFERADGLDNRASAANGARWTVEGGGAMLRGCATLCSKPHVPLKPSWTGRTLGGALARRCERQAKGKECFVENDLDRANRREHAEVRHLQGSAACSSVDL